MQIAINPRGVENVFVALFFPPFVWRVSSFLPAVCSGCEGLACSFWRTAAARSRSCPTSPASDITRLKGEKTKWSDAIVLGLDWAARRHLLDHLVALSAVHAQQRAPVLHVGMKHLQDLLGGQLFAHPLVLTCGHTHTNNTSDTLAWLDLAVCVCVWTRVNSHQPRTVCFPHVITYSLFWFFPGITSNFMLVSPIPWFLWRSGTMCNCFWETCAKAWFPSQSEVNQICRRRRDLAKRNRVREFQWLFSLRRSPFKALVKDLIWRK